MYWYRAELQWRGEAIRWLKRDYPESQCLTSIWLSLCFSASGVCTGTRISAFNRSLFLVFLVLVILLLLYLCFFFIAVGSKWNRMSIIYSG
jgi:hypothetical protein